MKTAAGESLTILVILTESVVLLSLTKKLSLCMVGDSTDSGSTLHNYFKLP